jgi:hypothetical protein
MLLINKYVPAQRFALGIGQACGTEPTVFNRSYMADMFYPVLRHGWDGFSFHGAKVRKKIDTRKREGVFF